jgi:hypothetical protein
VCEGGSKEKGGERSIYVLRGRKEREVEGEDGGVEAE